MIAYDAKNRVVSRTWNGATTFFVYDGWNLIAEYTSAGTLQAKCVHGLGSDEHIAKIDATYGTVYSHQDGLGSVVALTDNTGNVLERYRYDAFGKATVFDASLNTLTATAYGNRFLYTGREYIAELGLYDYRNRVYSADLGRFIQTDPIRFEAGDVNIYRYCGNNAVMGLDPSGECFWGSVGNILAGAAAGAATGALTGGVIGAGIGAVGGAGIGAVPGAAVGATAGALGGAISGAINGFWRGGANGNSNIGGALASGAESGALAGATGAAGAVGGILAGAGVGALAGGYSGYQASTGDLGGTAAGFLGGGLLGGLGGANGLSPLAGGLMGGMTGVVGENFNAGIGLLEQAFPSSPKGLKQ